MEKKISCAFCELVMTEEWPKDRIALRCGGEGIHYGHVTHVFPATFPLAAGNTEAPFWCIKRGETL